MIRQIDWNAVATWAALITALVAIIGLWQQIKWSRLSMGVELWWRLEERFRYDEKMRERRRKAAQGLLKNEFAPELDEIIDFFETIGFLVRRKLLDEEVVWTHFYYRTIGYWFAAQQRIKEVRSKDEAIWIEFEYLVNRMLIIEKKKSGKPFIEPPSEEFLRDFLLEESTA